MKLLQVIETRPEKNHISKIDSGQFKVAAIGEGKCTLASYNRRDFYKITLVTKCNSRLDYANRSIGVKRPALIFTNPLVPYFWQGEISEEESAGYFCVFTDDFLHTRNYQESLQDSLLFKAGGEPVYFLNDKQVSYLSILFSQMREKVDTGYVYKNDLMRSHVNLIFHEAIMMQPAIAYYTPPNAASRLANLFLSLLNKQFPVDLPLQIIKLKKAGDYADQLAVHVNYLNAAVQEATGKATTVHINEKLITEAKSLLTFTDYNVAEISYSLGFEYPSYFNNFFKKHTGITPMSVRKLL